MIRRSWFLVVITGWLGLCLVSSQGVALANSPSVPPPAGPAVAQGAPSAVFTLDQAIQMAVRQNPQVTAAQQTVVAAEQHVIEARAGFFPAVSITGTTAYGTTSSTGVPLSSATSTASVGVTGSLSIFDNGRTRIATEQAEAALASARALLRQTQQDVALSAATDFLNVLKAQRIATARQVALDKAQQQLAQSQAQFRAGTAAQADVIQAQAQVAQARVDFLAAQGQIEITRVALRGVLSMDLLAPIDLQDPAVQPAPLTVTTDAAVQEAIQNRPEVAKANADVQASQANLASAYASVGFQVTVGANTTYFIASTQPGASNATAWAITASVSVPIFDAGKGAATINEAKATLAAFEAKAESTLLTVRQDAYQSYLSAVQAATNLDATQAAQDAANAALDAAQGRYRAGVGTIVEVTTAQAAAALANVNAINGRYDYQTALATLRHALGRPIVGGSL